MKRIILVLCGFFTILATTSHAKEPFDFGIKLGFANSGITGLDAAKTPLGSADVEPKILNPGFMGLVYGEYSVHEMVGIALEVGYSMGQGGSFSKKGDDKNTYKINVQKVDICFGPVIYPMGRESEEGILKFNVGMWSAVPVKVEGQKNEVKATEVKADDLTTLGIGVVGGIGYELPFGLLIGMTGNYAFTDLFKEASTFKKTTLGITDAKNNTNLWGVNLSLGYNLAVLLED